jgi:O-antigen/teichoic acid export membrane protein
MRTQPSRVSALLPEKSFGRGVAVLVSGNVAGQTLVVLASPLVTRLFAPSAFGVLAVYTSIFAILLVYASLRYEAAVPLADNDGDAVSVLALSMALVPIVSGITWLLVPYLGPVVVRAVDAPALEGYLWLLPIGLLAGGLAQAITYWGVREKQFLILSYSRTIQSATQVGIQVAAGAGGVGAGGLIFGLVGGRIANAVTILVRSRIPWRMLRPSTWWGQAKKYRHFPLYTTWASLLNNAGTTATPLFFALFFPIGTVGFIALDVRILSLPALVLGQAVAQVFYPTAAGLINDPAELRKLVWRVSTALLLASLPVFGFLAATAPTLFPYVFGDRWAAAGGFARLLVPWLALSFIASPISTLSFAKNRQRTAFAITMYETALRLGGIWVGGVLGSPALATFLYSMAGMVISAVYIAWMLRLVRLSMREWLGPIAPHLLMTCLVIAVFVWANAAAPSLPVAALTGCVMLALALWNIRRYRSMAGEWAACTS